MFNKEAKIYDQFYANKNYRKEVNEMSGFLSGTMILDRFSPLLLWKAFEANINV